MYCFRYRDIRVSSRYIWTIWYGFSVETDLDLVQLTTNDRQNVNFPVPLAVLFSLSLLALAFYIDSFSNSFSCEFNFFATSWTEKCMSLKIFMKARLSVYWVRHFFHWECWTCNAWTSIIFKNWEQALTSRTLSAYSFVGYHELASDSILKDLSPTKIEEIFIKKRFLSFPANLYSFPDRLHLTLFLLGIEEMNPKNIFHNLSLRYPSDKTDYKNNI